MFSLELINPEKKRKRKYTNSGIISLNSVKYVRMFLNLQLVEPLTKDTCI